MDTNQSLEHYEAIYKAALAAQEVAHFSPKCLKKVEELQQRCRICGCTDDGTFVELDAVQDFEFESSICSYRVLFQRTSLQFQFNTMPDLPSRICVRCGYKAKIFYLQTRQFVLGQHAMRSSITDWYQKKYGVEAPEQKEDRIQLMKLLVLAKASLYKKQRDTPAKLQPVVNTLMNQNTKLCPIELKRSVSADDRLNAGCDKLQSNNDKDLKTGPMARSTVNLRYPPRGCNTVPKTVRRSKPLQSQTARSEISKIAYGEKPNREKTIIKPTEPRECIVTPRVSKLDRFLNKSNSNRKTVETTGTTEAQLQQKLQERRRQWR